MTTEQTCKHCKNYVGKCPACHRVLPTIGAADVLSILNELSIIPTNFEERIFQGAIDEVRRRITQWGANP